MLVKLGGFAPDIDPTTPGVLTACTAKVPTLKGMRGAPSRVTVGLPALAAACIGAQVLELLDGTHRVFAGTTTKIYESNGSTWDDVSRTVGGAYSAASDKRWRFAQYGNVSLAVQKSDVLQYSNGSGAFANLTAPQASIVETVGDHVFLFDTQEGTYGDSPNRWWTSALGDYTNWTPSVANNSYTGTLTSSPGAIRAGRRLGDQIVAYKGRSMFLGTFQGPPLGWTFIEVSNTVGAQSQEVVVPIVTPQGGAAHIFMGQDNFYYYDGAKPVPVGNPIKDWFFGRLNVDFSYLSVALRDTDNSLIYFFYPSTSSGTGALDSCVVYNYRADKWGVYDQDIEAALEYFTGGFTYATLQSTYSTYSGLPSISYGSPFWFAGSSFPAVFNTSHILQSLTGETSTSSMTTGDLGDDEKVLMASRVRPRYMTAPDSATLTNYHRMNLGDSLVTDMTVSLNNGKFDFMRSARWHRVKIDDTGDVETSALDVEAIEDGDE